MIDLKWLEDIDITESAEVTTATVLDAGLTITKDLVKPVITEKDYLGTVYVGVPLPGIPKGLLTDEHKERLAKEGEKELSKTFSEAAGFTVVVSVKRGSIEIAGETFSKYVFMEVELGKGFAPTQIDELIAFNMAKIAVTRKKQSLVEYIIEQTSKLPGSKVVYIPSGADLAYQVPSVVLGGMVIGWMITISLAAVSVMLASYWWTQSKKYISPNPENVRAVLDDAMMPVDHKITVVGDKVNQIDEAVKRGDTDTANRLLKEVKVDVQQLKKQIDFALEESAKKVAKSMGVEVKEPPLIDRFVDFFKEKIPLFELWLTMGVTVLALYVFDMVRVGELVKKFKQPPEEVRW